MSYVQFEGAETKETYPFFNILGSDGTFRLTVPEGTEGAIRREYETSDKKTGVKFELVFKSLTGTIEHISMFDGEYGTNIFVTLLDQNNRRAKFSVSVNSPFGEDLMKKLPAIDPDIPVTFAPFAFDTPEGKTKKGITITQNNIKITSYFNEYDTETKKTTNKHGYPEPKGDTSKYNSDKWKLYFGECRIWLMEYLQDHVIPKYEIEHVVDEPLASTDVSSEEIPF